MWRLDRTGWGYVLADIGDVNEFKQVTHTHFEIFAQGIESIDVNSIGRFLIQEGNRVSVQARIARNITDLELSLTHKTG
jgi:hypothetical protein